MCKQTLSIENLIEDIFEFRLSDGSQIALKCKKSKIIISRQCNSDLLFLESRLFRDIKEATGFFSAYEDYAHIHVSPFDRIRAILQRVEEVPHCKMCNKYAKLMADRPFSRKMFAQFCNESCQAAYASCKRKPISNSCRQLHSEKMSKFIKERLSRYVDLFFRLCNKQCNDEIIDDVIRRCKQMVNDQKHMTMKDINDDNFVAGMMKLTKFIPLPVHKELITSRDEFRSDERIYCIANNITDIPRCSYCNENQVKFIRFNRGYSDVCSSPRCLNDKIRRSKGLLTTRDIIEYIKKDGNYDIISFPDVFSKGKLEIKCNKCGNISSHILRNGTTQHIDYFHLCSFCDRYSSNEEKLIREMLDKMKVIYLPNDRKLISPIELDIVIPDYKIAIEYDSFYWHNTDIVKPYYHKHKTDLCLKNGYLLIHVFENELMNKRYAIESYLKRFLKPEILDNIDLDKCRLNVINDFKAVKEFVSTNSLFFFEDDYDSCEIILLVILDEVIACQMFLDVRMNIRHEYDFLLVGTCIKNGYIVKGAVEKMIDSFADRHKGSVIRTYIDNRWPDLTLEYLKIGFKVKNTTGIMGKFYKRSNPRKNLLIKSQMKDFLINDRKYDFSKSLLLNAKDAGYNRICDCGLTGLQITL